MPNYSKTGNPLSRRFSKSKPPSNILSETSLCSRIFQCKPSTQSSSGKNEAELWIPLNSSCTMSASVDSYGGYPVFMRDQTRRPTVRSLALSEIFYPLDDDGSQQSASRSRSACPPVAGDRRSCFLFSNEPQPTEMQTPPTRSASHLSSRSKNNKTSDSSETSLLHKLQALFHINTSGGKQKTKKSAAVAQKPPQPPVIRRLPPVQMPPPLINLGPKGPIRSRSQSAFRSQRNAKTQSDVFIPNLCAPVVYLVPVCCASTTSAGGVSSFVPSRPSNLPLNSAPRARHPLLSGPMSSAQRISAQRREEIRQKHYSAHVPGETLQLPSQASSGKIGLLIFDFLQLSRQVVNALILFFV